MVGDRSRGSTVVRRYGMEISIILVGTSVGAMGALYGMTCDSAHFGITLANAIVTLGSGIILGGGLKLLLESYQASKRERDELDELRERGS